MFLSVTGIHSSNLSVIVKEVVSLHLSPLFECNQFSDYSLFFSGWVFFSEHVPHLGFLLRTVLFYDTYAEATV